MNNTPNNDNYFITDGSWNIGKVLVCTGEWDPKLIEVMRENGIVNLRLSGSVGREGKDINFLSSIPFLKGIEIYFSSIKDLSPIYSLEELEVLGLDGYIKAEFDFNKLPKLKKCFITWNKKYQNLFDVSTLNHLIIDKYPFENLNAMSNLKDLEILDITSRKLQSLKGIESLKKLQELKMFRCVNLIDLSGIEYLTELRVLDINTCRKIHNLNGCEKLDKLEQIRLENCKEIDSLRLLKHCNRLKRIIFIGDTSIDDGDISELLKLPLLTDLRFTEKKHYTLKREQVSTLLQRK
ncbi:hypothetical protein IMZ08_02630 [Bacillus luteolus]|uniref:Leucine-rich repeat domain-containing protein n=1 Tax=Litchfieldia luteola TaxID=682179 RepID=A0ABR9QEM5_9BACI|nr:hypothetical protein [Cytobacillus luteolus]MBE4906952.1 hypothetical protein [Cytobacillus luteolus]MBP1943583.1 hypothetical protein [Cytobacillus luteolus]